jgi:hypothetical protein
VPLAPPVPQGNPLSRPHAAPLPPSNFASGQSCASRDYDLTGEAWATCSATLELPQNFSAVNSARGPDYPLPQAPSQAGELVAGVTAVVTAPAAVGRSRRSTTF